jgi:hypothetical protein
MAVPFVHWLVYGIPADLQRLDRMALAKTRQGQNSKLNATYLPAAPPPGHGLHHYRFQLFALDTGVDLESGAGRSEVLDAVQGHGLGWGELVGVYERRQDEPASSVWTDEGRLEVGRQLGHVDQGRLSRIDLGSGHANRQIPVGDNPDHVSGILNDDGSYVVLVEGPGGVVRRRGRSQNDHALVPTILLQRHALESVQGQGRSPVPPGLDFGRGSDVAQFLDHAHWLHWTG